MPRCRYTTSGRLTLLILLIVRQEPWAFCRFNSSAYEWPEHFLKLFFIQMMSNERLNTENAVRSLTFSKMSVTHSHSCITSHTNTAKTFRGQLNFENKCRLVVCHWLILVYLSPSEVTHIKIDRRCFAPNQIRWLNFIHELFFCNSLYGIRFEKTSNEHTSTHVQAVRLLSQFVVIFHHHFVQFTSFALQFPIKFRKDGMLLFRSNRIKFGRRLRTDQKTP